MANSLSDLTAAIQAETQAIADLATRISNLPGPVDLTDAVTAVNANAATINGLAQPQ